MMKAIIHAINDDNVPGLQHLLGSLTNYDVNQPNKVVWVCADMCGGLAIILLNRVTWLWNRSVTPGMKRIRQVDGK